MSSLPWCCAVAKNSLSNSETTNVSCTVLRMRVRQVKRLRTAIGRWEQYMMVLPRTPGTAFNAAPPMLKEVHDCLCSMMGLFLRLALYLPPSICQENAQALAQN